MHSISGSSMPGKYDRLLVVMTYPARRNLGGGNTAVDCSRSALRLGARRVRILHRRSRHEMPCLMAEVEAAEAEGVQVDLLVAPLRLDVVERESLPDGRGSDAASGAATVRERSNLVLTCQRMTLGEPDASGRRRPVPVEGSDPK